MTWVPLAGLVRGLATGARYEAEARLSSRGPFQSHIADAELARRLRWDATVRSRTDPLGEWRAHEASAWSQNGEDGLIAAFLAALGRDTGSFVEIGAADGEENCTRRLAEEGWSGAWFEGDGDLVERATKTAAEWPIEVHQAIVTSRNVCELLRLSGVPTAPDLLVLDIDGNDFWVLRSLLDQFRPSLLVCEYNAAFPPGHFWTRRNRPTVGWDGTHRHGASLDALHWLAERRGYGLIACDSTGVNAFFARLDEVPAELKALVGAPSLHYRPLRSAPPSFGHPKRRTPPSTVLAPEDVGLAQLETVELLDRPTLAPGLVCVSVGIFNGSATTLTSSQPHPVHLSGHWLGHGGVVVQHDADRNVLTSEVPPGRRVRALGVFRQPSGATTLRVRLVQEGVAWLGEGMDIVIDNSC